MRCRWSYRILAALLGKFAAKLAARGVNITTGYQTALKGSKKASIVLVVSDLANAVSVR